jgi:hypothetical protein
MPKEKKHYRRPHIRSGGQTGVDRAALDAAILAGLPYEGWCPKGGWAEDFPQPPGLLTKYPGLRETPSEAPEERTEWNVRDSAATLILVPHGNYCSPGSGFTIESARKYGKLCTIVPYSEKGAAARVRDVLSQLREEESLNIAGPRESEHPGAYDRCLAVLAEAFGLLARKTNCTKS